MLTLTDAKGITYLTNEYDSAGRVSTQAQADGGQWHFAYTTSSGVITQLSTLFRYDNLNRVTEIADARQGITRFGYDSNGNLLSVQDAKAQATNYTYDNMDRLGTRTDALSRSENYQYDPAGNLCPVRLSGS